MEAIIYARFSKADQVKGHSIERQIDHIKEVCAARGYQPTSRLTFTEKGKSAFSGANRAKGSLLANIELEIEAGAHHGRVLVVEHLDRISRQGHQEVTDFIRTCSDNGVSIATWDGSRFYPAGQRVQMIEIIEIILKAELAREESEKKSFRIRKSFAAKREAANDGGRKIATRPPAWLKRNAERSGFEIIEEKANIVREAHRLAQMGFGAVQIVKRFNEAGTPTWTGKNGWKETYLMKVLKSRSAIGEYVSKTHGTRIIDYYPAIITVDHFNRTLAAVDKRTSPHTRGRRGTSQSNLFSGFVKCQHCGGTMEYRSARQVGDPETRLRKSGNVHTTIARTAANYFRCVNNLRKTSHACPNAKAVRYERLEKTVLDKVLTLAMDNERFNVSEISATRIQLAEVERQLGHHQESLQNIKANLRIKVSTTLMDMLTEIEDQIAAATIERDDLAKALNRERGSQPSAAFLERIRQTREKMSDPDHNIRKDARTLVHDSLSGIISEIMCDDKANSTVVVAHGLAAFRVTDAGDIDWQHDSSNDPLAITALSSGAYADNAGVVEAVLMRAKR